MERIKELRKQRGISQTELGKVLNIAQNTLSAYECGRRDPDTETLSAIAQYFDVSTDYLLGRTDTPKKKTPPQSDGNFTPTITERDELDISKRLNAVLEDLGSTSEALMFDGEPLELDDDTRDALIKSIENSIRMGKLIAKQKYTPKKYRKDSNK